MASINPISTRRQMTAIARFMRSGTSTWVDLGDIMSWKNASDVKRTPIMASLPGMRLQIAEIPAEVAWRYELTTNEVTIETMKLLNLGISGADVVQLSGSGLTATLTAAFRQWLPLNKEAVTVVSIKNASNTITYTAGADYEVDGGLGLIRIYETGLITEGQTLNVIFNCAATTRKSITGLSDFYVAGVMVLSALDQHDNPTNRAIEEHTFPCQLYISDYGTSDGSKIMEVTYRANATKKPTITQRV